MDHVNDPGDINRSSKRWSEPAVSIEEVASDSVVFVGLINDDLTAEVRRKSCQSIDVYCDTLKTQPKADFMRMNGEVVSLQAAFVTTSVDKREISSSKKVNARMVGSQTFILAERLPYASTVEQLGTVELKLC